MNPITVFGAKSPIVGMNADLGAEFIGPSYGQLVQNLRLVSGYAVARPGYGTALAGNVDASASFRGADYVPGVGMMAAFRIGSATRVYRFTSGSAWQEVTSSTTRFATDGNVGFAPITLARSDTQTAATYFNGAIFGNASNSNRIFYRNPSDVVYVLDSASKPLSVTQIPVPMGVHWFANDTARVFDNSSADFTGSAAAASTTGITFTLNTAAATGSTIKLAFGVYDPNTITPPNVSTGTARGGVTLGSHVGFLWSVNRSGGGWGRSRAANGLDVPNYISLIEIISAVPGTVAKTITNAVNNGSGLVRVTSAAHGLSTGDMVYVYGIDGIGTTNSVYTITVIDANTFDLQGSSFSGAYTSGGFAKLTEYATLYSANNNALPVVVNVPNSASGANNGAWFYYQTGPLFSRASVYGYRITIVPPTSNVSSTLMGAISTGYVDPFAIYAASFGLAGAYNEGESVTGSVEYSPCDTGPYGASGRNYAYIPPSGVMTKWYVKAIGVQSSVQDTFYVYRSNPELNEQGQITYGPFYYLGDNGSQTQNSNPNPYSAFASNIKDDNVLTSDLDFSRIAYDETHQLPPSANVFCSANDRLFVGNVKDRADELWVSADSNMLDFSKVVRQNAGALDPLSPVYRTFSGESVKALKRISSTLFGTDTVLLWTNAGLYRLGGYTVEEISQASRISNQGINYPATIAQYGNLTYYLDNEGQIRFTNGASISDSLSYQQVNSLIDGGVIANATAFASNECYELFYRSESSGTGNNSGLYYDVRLNGWTKDVYSPDIRGVVVESKEPKNRILVITELGSVYVWNNSANTTDAGNNIAVNFTSRILSTEWDRMRFGRAGVVCTDASGSMTITRSFRATENPSGVNVPATSTLNMDSSFTNSWRMDTLSGATGVAGASGYGGWVSFAATVPGGWRLYQAKIDASGTSIGGASV